MIRVKLPQHLRNLARTEREVQLQVASPVTQATVLDALGLDPPAEVDGRSLL